MDGKLNGTRGASIAMAITIFLVLSLFSLAMVSIATTALSGTGEQQEQEQAYMAISSAARLMQSAIDGKRITETYKDKDPAIASWTLNYEIDSSVTGNERVFLEAIQALLNTTRDTQEKICHPEASASRQGSSTLTVTVMDGDQWFRYIPQVTVQFTFTKQALSTSSVEKKDKNGNGITNSEKSDEKFYDVNDVQRYDINADFSVRTTAEKSYNIRVLLKGDFRPHPIMETSGTAPVQVGTETFLYWTVGNVEVGNKWQLRN